MTARPPFGVAVPIRAFSVGSTRLAGALDADTRTALAMQLAARVVQAAGAAPVVVVSDAPEVVEWAHACGATVVTDPGTLDGAAAAGQASLAARGCLRAVIAHADLPTITTFASVTRDAGAPVAVLVPCHRDDGTPVCSVPADTSFRFAYGPGSFRRHVAAAHTAGLAVRVVRDRRLGFDIDTADDLAALERQDPTLLGTRAAGYGTRP